MEHNVQQLIAVGLAGLIVGAGGMGFINSRHQEVTIVEGFAYANVTGDAIGFSEERNDEQQDGYSLLPQVGSGDGSLPTCIAPLKSTPVRLGITHIDPQEEFAGRDVVVWLECTGPSEKP